MGPRTTHVQRGRTRAAEKWHQFRSNYQLKKNTARILSGSGYLMEIYQYTHDLGSVSIQWDTSSRESKKQVAPPSWAHNRAGNNTLYMIALWWRTSAAGRMIYGVSVFLWVIREDNKLGSLASKRVLFPCLSKDHVPIVEIKETKVHVELPSEPLSASDGHTPLWRRVKMVPEVVGYGECVQRRRLDPDPLLPQAIPGCAGCSCNCNFLHLLP